MGRIQALSTSDSRHTAASAALRDPLWVQIVLIVLGLGFFSLFLLLPLAAVFAQALSKGWQLYVQALLDPDALAAIRLTLLVAAIAVPLNVVFGIAAAWSITKFDFRGKNLLITLIDLPFSVSPVVAGLIYVLCLGRRAGWVLGWPSMTSKSFLLCRASSWRRCLSPSLSLRAN